MTSTTDTTAAVDSDMTPDQIAFTNAFNKQRGSLAGFARCWSREELDVVRDGLYLGLASDLLPTVYTNVQEVIVATPSVAATRGTSGGFTTMIHVARTSPDWPALADQVLQLADKVDCDLTSIWNTLQNGRMEWIQAINGAQALKTLLQEMLQRDAATSSVGDVSDAKMIWMYALSLNIPSLQAEREAWARTVQLKDPLRPLVKYQAPLWDARREDWRALDVGVQNVAERGGSSVDEIWNIGFEQEPEQQPQQQQGNGGSKK
eukprot:scaffold2062_cov166-Amphora_coffeaeformis.AAC.7